MSVEDAKRSYIRKCPINRRLRLSNNSKYAEYRELTIPDRGFRKYFLVYWHNARLRNIVFGLSEDEVFALSKQNCHYCGQEPSVRNAKYNNPYVCNGIDRVDSRIGYCTENCVPCCKDCNYAKRAMTFEEFTNWIRRIAGYNKVV